MPDNFLTRSMISNPSQRTELNPKKSDKTDAEKIAEFNSLWEIQPNGYFKRKEPTDAQ